MSSFILHMSARKSALVRGKLSGVSPFICWFQGSNLGPQAWQQLPLPSEPSSWPTPILFENYTG